jgi:DNA-binding transcriptional MerR regulator
MSTQQHQEDPDTDPHTGPATDPALDLTVDELAARAGVTVRTVRFYGTRGLLPPPVLGPRRVGRYGAVHLARLALIEELQRHGMTLAAIERYLERLPADLSSRDLAVHRALVACWSPYRPEVLSRAQLERRTGRALSEADVERLTAMEVLRPADGGAGYAVDPGLLPLGVQLLDVPIPLETLVAARTVLLEHSRAAARELSGMFRDEVWQPHLARESAGERAEHVREMKALSTHMQPVIVQALVTVFTRSLHEEVHAWAPDGGEGEGDTADGAS